MAPKTNRAQSTGAKAGSAADKPLPLRTSVAEKMRNPTARMGSDVPESHRRGSTKGKAQESHRGKAPESHRGEKKKDKGGSPPKKGDNKLSPLKEEKAERTSGSPNAKPTGAASSDGAQMPKVVSSSDKLGEARKKVDFITEELMGRKPLDDKARETLIKKCGPAKQEVHHERNESHRPVGRPDELAPSRHERVPPSCIVLMFNCFESSFDLAYGDISTLPESCATCGWATGCGRPAR